MYIFTEITDRFIASRHSTSIIPSMYQNTGKMNTLLVRMLVLLYYSPVSYATPTSSAIPPPSISRSSATYDWCDCSLGTTSITVWPLNQKKTDSVVVTAGTPHWIHWNTPVSSVGWNCGGTSADQKSVLVAPLSQWSVQLLSSEKGIGCNKKSGRLHFANFNHTNHSSVVYSSGENGYACIKIPALLRLMSGRLLAFAEARMVTCSDFAWTDLVVKRSDDNGTTWSSLSVVRTESNATSVPTVIGNAAPVELRSTGKILVPHTRNNTDVWIVTSHDEGMTWSMPRSLGNNVTQPEWLWVGTGKVVRGTFPNAIFMSYDLPSFPLFPSIPSSLSFFFLPSVHDSFFFLLLPLFLHASRTYFAHMYRATWIIGISKWAHRCSELSLNNAW